AIAPIKPAMASTRQQLVADSLGACTTDGAPCDARRNAHLRLSGDRSLDLEVRTPCASVIIGAGMSIPHLVALEPAGHRRRRSIPCPNAFPIEPSCFSASHAS